MLDEISINNFAFYHPVTILFLDDNQNFLDMVDIELHSKFNMLFFSNPDLALQAIVDSDRFKPKYVTRNFLEEDTISSHSSMVELFSLREMIYEKGRFNQIALAIIDQKMPKITGLDFCKLISTKKSIFKMILTIEVDKELVFESFNQGLIEQFLLKKEDNLIEDIIKSIEILKNRYFYQLSKYFFTNLNKRTIELFHNDEFKKIFDQVALKSNSIEYYLLDDSGSYLFLDRKGNPTWLIIRSEEHFKYQIEMLEGLDGSDKIISTLKNRNQLLFLLGESDYKKNVHEWNSFLFDAKPLAKNYYYSIAEGYVSDSIEWKKLSPYENRKN